MVELDRTCPRNLAVLQCGIEVIIFPWSELLTLRELVSKIPAEATADENFPCQNHDDWTVIGSPQGLSLMRSGTSRALHFSPDDWLALGEKLYVGDDLLMQLDVVELSGKSQSRVSEAITAGRLFAFQVPDLQRRQWRIPRRAIKEWLE